MAKPRTLLPSKPGKEHLLIRQVRRGISGPETIVDALAGMQNTTSASGFLSGGNIIRKPDYVERENLSEEDLVRLRWIRKILSIVIEPNQLSMRSTPEMDRRALVSKLNKAPLSTLIRLLPQSLKDKSATELKEVLGNTTDLITDDEKAEIQELYRDVSP